MTFRPDKVEYYLSIANQISARSTCMHIKIGAIIVRDDQIIAAGYVGAPRKTMDCFQRDECLRRKLNIPSGHRYELCRSIHAEMNAIINASRAGVSLLNGDMYIYGERLDNGKTIKINAFPCFICKKMIINSGLNKVICTTIDGSYQEFSVTQWADDWRNKDMLDDVDIYGARQEISV
ncbi:MAG: dCMP deaminase family protein [Pseudomonadota bacterium]